jgi:hypothetical protein
MATFAKRSKRTTRKKGPRPAPATGAGEDKRTSRTAPTPAYRRFVKLALTFPGVEESSSYGTPALKVKGKLLSRLRTEAEGALALRCDFIDREILLQADRAAFFVTDHYLNYPMILIRLDKVRADALPDLFERAWRMQATPKLIAQYEQQSSAPQRRK